MWKCHDETLIMYNSYMLIKIETVSKIFMCLIHPILIFSYDTDYGFNFLLFIKFLSLLKKLDLQLKLCVLERLKVEEHNVYPALAIEWALISKN